MPLCLAWRSSASYKHIGPSYNAAHLFLENYFALVFFANA